jgi:ABC-2 type transport system permease protein/Cu-processing system permease protein
MKVIPISLPLPADGSPLSAVVLREVRGSITSRYFQVFSAIALAGGIGAITIPEDSSAANLFILQLALYCVSLFALLLGVNSARAESREWPLLFSQPVARGAYLLGKFLALLAIFATALVLLFLPALMVGARSLQLLQLYVFTVELTAVFIALGLLSGFLARERVQGLIIAMVAWLFLLVGFDLVALFGARWPLVQKVPDLWVWLLMLNPLDAFRTQVLFAMEQIPTEAANKTALAAWWLSHAGIWFSFLCPMWILVLLGVSARHLAHWEE